MGDEVGGRGSSRRDFLKGGAAAGVGVAGLSALLAAEASADTGTAPVRAPGQRTMIGVPFARHSTVRIGIIGVGARGRPVMQMFLASPGTRVVAICDTDASLAAAAAADVVRAGQPAPAQYTAGPDAYLDLVARTDIDLVLVATPWEGHRPQAVAALRAGKHVAVETPLATSLADLWAIVDASEVAQRHCLMLENVSYGQNELRLLKLAHAGKFGELLQGTGGYCHDLRPNLFSGQPRMEWRRRALTHRIGDIYSQHGLAPISAVFDINRGDRYTKLVSATSPARALAKYRQDHVPTSSPTWRETYVTGDRTISLLATANGKTVRAESTFTEPAPYTRMLSLQGTLGEYADDPARVYLNPEMTNQQWGSWEAYRAGYDHWLWRDVAPTAPDGGHGSMDYLMAYRIVQTMRLGLVPDFDVYDSATWSIAIALSAESLATATNGLGAVVSVPDFTRDSWRAARPGLDSTRP